MSEWLISRTDTVEILLYHLDVGRVRTIRNESFLSGTIMTIDLKTDAKGKHLD